MKNYLYLCFSIIIFSCNITSKNTTAGTDFLLPIQGVWNVTEISGVAQADIKNSDNNPFLKVENNKINGYDGCNNYFSSIIKITNNIIEFNVIGATKKWCFNADFANVYGKLLTQVHTYSIEKNKLTFYNKQANKIIIYTKKD